MGDFKTWIAIIPVIAIFFAGIAGYGALNQRVANLESNDVALEKRLERAEARDDDSMAQIDDRIDRSESRTQRQIDDLKEDVSTFWALFLEYALRDAERDAVDLLP